jgi:hypothetical protein
VSKRKLHEDDIYVAPYTKRFGKYRYVPGHYRRAHNGEKRNNISFDLSSSSNKPFIWIIALLFPPIMWVYFIPSLIKEKNFFLCFLILIYTIFYFYVVVR